MEGLFDSKGINIIVAGEKEIQDFLNNVEITMFIIEGKTCITKHDVFTQFANKLRFPKSFGYNWDAFDEYFGDLSWIRETEYLIFLKDVDKISVSDEELTILFHILFETAKEWQNQRKSILLHCCPEYEDDITAKLSEIGITYIKTISV